jgi:hypothetical protein
MHDFNVIVTVIGGMVLAIGLFSRAVPNRLYISEPLLALAVGVAISPYGLKHPSSWESFYPLREEASRLTLGIALRGVPFGFDRNGSRATGPCGRVCVFQRRRAPA